MSVLRTAIVLMLAAPSFAADGVPTPSLLIAHEWGTFTSVAGVDGNPVQWMPLAQPSDLPCFVYRLAGHNFKVDPRSPSLVRMETPVLYFYAPRSVTLSVKVRFPQGLITEWYPRASVTGFPATEWHGVEVNPEDNPTFPAGSAASHYYAARNTDAAPLRIGDQQEKMIFYRGTGNFSVPLRPRFVSEDTLEIRNAGRMPIPAAVLFENRGGLVGYRWMEGLRDSVQVQTPELSGDLDVLRQKLAATLVAFGLYQKEADAMIETWRDSWFEEGTRIIYIVPCAIVDSVLPLNIQPAPAAIARVFVGRAEVLSPTMRRGVENAVGSGDVSSLEKYGRFLTPFLEQIDGDHPVFRAPETAAFLKKMNVVAKREFDKPTCAQ